MRTSLAHAAWFLLVLSCGKSVDAPHANDPSSESPKEELKLPVVVEQANAEIEADYLSTQGWNRDGRPNDKVVRLLVNALSAVKGDLIVSFDRDGNQETLAYEEDLRPSVLSFLEHEGSAHVWARSEDRGLKLTKIDVETLPESKLNLRAKFERGLTKGEVLEGDFRVGAQGKISHCHGAEQEMGIVDSLAVALQFPHWPKEEDREKKECFRVSAKVVDGAHLRVLEFTKDGVTESLPTDGVLRSVQQVVRGARGAKGTLRQCGVPLKGSTLLSPLPYDGVLTLATPSDLREKATELIDHCALLEFDLTSSPVPVKATVLGIGVRVTGKLTGIRALETMPDVDQTPSERRKNEWLKNVRIDWPKSKGRTFVIDNFVRSKAKAPFAIPKALMTPYMSITWTGEEAPAKVRVAVDGFDDLSSKPRLRLVKIIDHGLPGSNGVAPSTPGPFSQVFNWVQKQGPQAIGATFNIRDSIRAWGGARIRLGWSYNAEEVELSSGAKRELEALVESGDAVLGSSLVMNVRHAGYEFGPRVSFDSERPVRPRFVVETVTPSTKVHRALHRPSLLPLLRAGTAASGRIFEANLAQGKSDGSGWVAFSECNAGTHWASVSVRMDRKDQWAHIDSIHGTCKKVKFLVESVAAVEPRTAEIVRYAVKILSVDQAHAPRGNAFAYASGGAVQVGAPWLVLSDGAWGRLMLEPRLPVWIPISASDASAQSWLETLLEADATVDVKTSSPKRHVAGFTFTEGQNPAPAKTIPGSIRRL